MRATTLANLALRKDAAAGLEPWQFATTNPGYVWLLAQQDAILESDLAADPAVASESVSAGSVSTSTAYRANSAGGAVTARTDVIEEAIRLYQRGGADSGSRSVAVFGGRRP
ncbi:MAG: hypothetical protein LBD30_00315 [Verrucomicrobiales bacterium]|jgi:hypothetical protein|nr:hypothetical protein [Verrucomicrobiales bacterium]